MVALTLSKDIATTEEVDASFGAGEIEFKQLFESDTKGRF